MGFFDNLDEKPKEELEEISSSELNEQTCKESDVSVPETTNGGQIQVADNKFVKEMTENEVAIKMARESYNNLKNQKDIAKKIKNVVTENTKADIEGANLTVEEKKKNNKVKRAEIANELYKLKQDKKYLKRESQHKLAMQKFNQRKEKYGDLLLRHCRKKIKNVNGKWEYQVDKNGDAIINMPNSFTLFFLIIFDSLVMFLNQAVDVFSGLNKVVTRIFWIILLIVFVFVPPVRQWLFGLIGLNMG